jgi:hypothetical protein
MTCCSCAEMFYHNSAGVLVRPVRAEPGPKSGIPIPKEEIFPNGDQEKFICYECLFKTEVAHMLGLYSTGFDFPQEDHGESMCGVSPTHLPWSSIP